MGQNIRSKYHPTHCLPLQDCPENGVSFRAQQCSKFNSVPYKGANHTWQPVMQHREY